MRKNGSVGASGIPLPVSIASAAAWPAIQAFMPIWRPAIKMATLPYRVYRVYRWAEAQSDRALRP